MPELPDVQVFKEYVDANALHREVETVSAREDRMFEVSSSTLRRHLLGRPLTGTRRHGKHLFVKIGEGERWLRLHFGMTGEPVYWEGDVGEGPDHQALRLDLEGGGHLAIRNTRKLGEVGLVEDPDAFIREKGLGPDPLEDFGLRHFRKALEGRRGTIKGTLMNQEVLAGMGNVYTDETLFRAGIHPEAKVPDLDEDEVEEIFRAMDEVLAAAIEARVDADEMPDDFLLPRRSEGAECPRCGGGIRKIEVSGRSTYFCADHQRNG